MQSPRLLTADEALRILSVRRQTLYAYVSKGWIRSVSLPNSREHRYVFEDVQRVHQRALARSGHGAAAAVALSGDTPLITSAISELRADGPWYRGHGALALARQGVPFESVCHLLWQGRLCEPPSSTSTPLALRRDFVQREIQDARHWHQQLASCLLTFEGLDDTVSYADCLALQHHAIAYLGHLGPAKRFVEARVGQSCVEHTIQSLGLDDTSLTRQSLNRYLILFCEHELSPSTFAIRTAASTGTEITTALASALAVTTGRALHGAYAKVQEWLINYPTLEALQAAARATLSAGQIPPGYNHPVYRDQDARSNGLMTFLRTHYAQLPSMQVLLGYVDWLSSEFGLHPHHEFASTALGRALGLPLHIVPALFVVARLAGWIAHFQEQTEQGQMFRPRAHTQERSK